MSRRRITTVLAVAAVIAAVLVASVIGIAASSGGGASGPITGEAADEAYYETLAELSETGVSVGGGLLDADARSDLEDSANQLLNAYEDAAAELDGLRLDDPGRESERARLVETSGPMLDALNEAADTADESELDALLVLVDERDALGEGLTALADALRGATDALRSGDADAYREALDRLRPAVEALASKAGL